MRRTLFLILAVTAVTIGVSCSSVAVIAPRDLTITAIGETHCRIYLYAESNGQLPSTLADLADRPGYSNRLEDAWGYELTYRIDDYGIITLASFGSDGKTGGSELRADIVRRFRTRNDDGRFIAGDDLWVVEGEIQ